MKFIDSHHPQWHHVVGEDGPKPDPDPAPHLLLSLEQWHAVRDHWPAGLPTGVELPNDYAVEDIAADLPRLALVVLQFPKWVDGRAYSQAKLLRSRYRFAGELRAAGEVLVDMLPLLARTGFDAVQMRADQSLAAAQRALAFFPAQARYQGDVETAQPIFARQEAP
ncbi:uncharacterized protein (DUF934 family) [Paucibacter oligotrophus]|uniref:Uncharacterized protein (DUF934 family) n=1 Tax=Roseateles oligotrophus TaxID=1769250 RepID=A0A840L1I1_9BURK|nr:DUF934 domain-containing protein [Roseateles oligotrophus]MBB4842314.1 uncharacterized protein (DUF934 family) [Roseateles oligotrophus]